MTSAPWRTNAKLSERDRPQGTTTRKDTAENELILKEDTDLAKHANTDELECAGLVSNNLGWRRWGDFGILPG